MGIEPEITAHYELGVERDRLTRWGRLEAERTRELLDRHLPPPPAVILDIGGAEGAYALPLAAAGYTVRLLDAVAGAALRGRKCGRRSAARPAVSPHQRGRPCRGDRGAHRGLRPGGVLLAAVISRFASTLDDALDDPARRDTVMRAIRRVESEPSLLGASPLAWDDGGRTQYRGEATDYRTVCRLLSSFAPSGAARMAAMIRIGAGITHRPWTMRSAKHWATLSATSHQARLSARKLRRVVLR